MNAAPPKQRFLVEYVGVGLALLLLTAVLVTIFLRSSQPGHNAPGSIFNSGADGVQILPSWLQQNGYQVGAIEISDQLISRDTQLLFILAPTSSYSRAELRQLESWVRAGGTLVLVQEDRQPRELPRQFDLRIGRFWPRAEQAALTLPTFNWPLVNSVQLNTNHAIRFRCGTAAVHLGDCQRAYFIATGLGNGQVFAFSSLYPFTNEGLTAANNAQLVQNLVLATAPGGTAVLFDEAHRRLPPSWLLNTPYGLALLGTILLLAFYMMLRGQRPATTIQTPQATAEIQGRETSEFISRLGRATMRTMSTERLMENYWLQLKRHLSRRYRLDPALPDTEFLAELRPLTDENKMGLVLYLVSTRQNEMFDDRRLSQWISTLTQLLES